DRSGDVLQRAESRLKPELAIFLPNSLLWLHPRARFLTDPSDEKASFFPDFTQCGPAQCGHQLAGAIINLAAKIFRRGFDKAAEPLVSRFEPSTRKDVVARHEAQSCTAPAQQDLAALLASTQENDTRCRPGAHSSFGRKRNHCGAVTPSAVMVSRLGSSEGSWGTSAVMVGRPSAAI